MNTDKRTDELLLLDNLALANKEYNEANGLPLSHPERSKLLSIATKNQADAMNKYNEHLKTLK